MRVLNIGFDKTLVGGVGFGDAVTRHREYGRHIEALDIIVATTRREALSPYVISPNVTGHPTNSANKLAFVSDALRIATRLHHERPVDLVVAQNPFLAGLVGFLLKRRLGLQLQVNFHGDFWGNPWWLKERWYNRVLLVGSHLLVPRADGVRVVSQALKRKLVSAGIDPDKVRVIPTPVDIGRFERFPVESRENRELIERLSPSDGKKMIVMVGRKDRVKDFDTLFRTMNLVHERSRAATLCLVGNYTAHEAYRLGLSREVEVLGAGMVDAPQLPAYYYASYLAVLTSTSEGYSKVLVEANACGRPTISTATSGAQEIIRDGYNGFVAPIGDPHALAARILELLADPARATTMGENGRTLVRQIVGNNTEKIVEFWRAICGAGEREGAAGRRP